MWIQFEGFKNRKAMLLVRARDFKKLKLIAKNTDPDIDASQTCYRCGKVMSVNGASGIIFCKHCKSNGDNLKCKTCSKKFSTPSNMLKHTRRVHKPSNNHPTVSEKLLPTTNFQMVTAQSDLHVRQYVSVMTALRKAEVLTMLLFC